MRSRQNSEAASAVARRMAAVSAELAALRLTREDPAESGQDGGEPEERTHVRDDRWAHWWPEAPEDDEHYTVVSPERRAGRHLRGQRDRTGRGDREPASVLTPVHLVALSLLLCVAVALGAWWMARSRPEALATDVTAEPLLSPAASSGSASTVPGTAPESAGSGPSASASTQSAVVVVHVAGKVRSPGVQALPLGSRVADALAAAGGPRAGVSLTSLNLARLLTDGEQIVVGGAPGTSSPVPELPPAAASGGSADPPLVSLNSADQVTLESLPGVGPVTATAIIEHREQNGPFTSVDQLLDVQGIGEATLAELAPLVTL